MSTVLESLVGSCAKKLQDVITEEAILTLEVKDSLDELQRTMRQIQCFLSDAEQRRIEESAVENWLFELKDAAYKADDIIDLARLEGNKMVPDELSSSRCSVTHMVSQMICCLPSIQKDHGIAVRVKNLNNELKKISKLGENFLKLQNFQPREQVSTMRAIKTCELVEPNLVGKEISSACTKLVELILANKENKAYKIGIIGTGGVGKTTLSQKVYNDERIKRVFTKKAWICVSQEFSKDMLLKEILRNIGVKYMQEETVSELSKRLATAVENKTLFLVLDDVWQHDVWTDLFRTPLETAATVITVVTTRNDTTARVIGVEHLHRMELMSDDVGWELLWKSMNISKEAEVQSLRDTGLEIVRLCAGLPLAIKLIARVLATKERTENHWRKFLNKSAWSMSKCPIELRGALYLSYDDLPKHLKQCFLYCVLFPENEGMYRDDLIRFWIAEDFIEEEEGQLLEDTAEDYYIELINRHLLQVDPSYADGRRCTMHNLLRRLAEHISQDECFCGYPHLLDPKRVSKLRRIAITPDKDSVTSLELDQEHLKARTFLIHSPDIEPIIVDNTVFRRLPYIRVLDLTGSIIKDIPDCIGSLIHLRSLDLDRSDVSFLPESIGCLTNLQVLNLQHCYSLHKLPFGITRLSALRRLGLNGTPINQVPKGIGGLQFLNDVDGFPVSDGSVTFSTMQDGWDLLELCGLVHMRRLALIKLERPSSGTTTASMLINKKYLKKLDLWCSECTEETNSEEDTSTIEETFEKLIPPCNLESLSILEFFGRRYPTWLDTGHLGSLKFLTLNRCKSCILLPPIGVLPNLKYLHIKGATSVTKIGPEFIGCGLGNTGFAGAAFPMLETLIIDDMPNLEEWSFFGVEGEEAIAAAKWEWRENLLNKMNMQAMQQLHECGCCHV